MRTLKRNEQRFYYANLNRIEKVLDENGLYTGEKRAVYDDPVECYGNISPATGSVSIEMFGAVEAYDKVIVICDPDMNVSMTTVFWIDDSPVSEDHDDYDYIVGHVSRSLNSIAIAVKAVDVR